MSEADRAGVMEVTHIWSHLPTFWMFWGAISSTSGPGQTCAEMVTHIWSRIQTKYALTVTHQAGKLSPKSCGLSKLSTHKHSRFSELCALNRSHLCAYLVTPLIKNLYLPVSKSPVVGAAPNGDNPAGYRPTGLHLLPTAFF